MNQQSRTYGAALQVAALFPGFITQPLDPAENPQFVTMVRLRRADGAALHVFHHPPLKANDKSEIGISVQKIDEAPYGLTPPSGKWNAKSRLTDAQIAFDFKMQYGDQMHSYIEQGIAARREAIAFYESREALAQQLAAAGNGTYRPGRPRHDLTQTPCASHIHCASTGDKTHWRVEHFNHTSTELHVWATDEQALAIVRLLAANQL